jgi:uncharacterized membrane protein YdjX (TVP38/TMEM64 family)
MRSSRFEQPLPAVGLFWHNGANLSDGQIPGRRVGEKLVSEPSELSDNISGEKATFSPKRLIPIVVLIGGLIAFFALGLDKYVTLSALEENRQLLADWVRDNGVLAHAVYVVVYTFATAFSLPAAAIITISGGFLFGPWLGAGLSVIGATLGATAVFLAARYAFADLLRARAGPAIRKMEDGFKENALNYMLFLRFIPVFPFFIVNLVPAFLGVGLGTFFIGTLIGIIPGSLVYASLGDGFSAVVEKGGDINLGIIFEPRFLLPILGLAVLSLIPIVYKKLKNKAS